MADGILKELTKIGVEPEVTEGTYVAPGADTSYLQPLSDGFGIEPSTNVNERTVLSGGFTKARPISKINGCTASLNVEMRGSGLEGAQTDFHYLIKGLLGGERQIAARQTSGTTHTTTLLNFADTSAFAVGDIICVLEAGAYHVSPIISIVANVSITLLTAAGGAFSDAVEVAKVSTYYPSNSFSDYESLSLSYYSGDEIIERGMGCRPLSMAVSNFTASGLASLDFALEGVDYVEADGSAPHTPAYDTGTPPVIQNASLYIDSDEFCLESFAMSIENSKANLPSICADSGVRGTRWNGKRSVTGSINPYKDDTTVDFYTKLKANTAFSLFAFAANPSGTAGEFELGSIVAYYMPYCTVTKKVTGDIEGVLTDDIEFTADGTASGAETEVFISFI